MTASNPLQPLVNVSGGAKAGQESMLDPNEIATSYHIEGVSLSQRNGGLSRFSTIEKRHIEIDRTAKTLNQRNCPSLGRLFV